MIIVITGPTGVGKTKMSIELAKKLNGEIINADSTQVYKNLNIATAKITEEEKNGIKHHLFDIKNLDEDYTVYDYQKDVRKLINDILNNGKVPILVGGTGLYIKAALYNYEFENISVNNYDDLTNEEIYQKLMILDPNNKIHKNNRKRMLRALGYVESTNIPYSDKEKSNELLYNALFIGLTTNRDNLYQIINNRVDSMLDSGLLDEAWKIYNTNIRSKAVMTPIGYKELFKFFDNEITLDEAIELIKKNSRHYAKRQYTFFNHQLPITWFNVNYQDFDETINEVLNFINSK